MSKFLDSYFYMNEGYRLKYILEKSGNSLITIAERAGIARATLYNYFSYEEIPRKKLASILTAAGIPEVNFWGEDIEETPKGIVEKLNLRITELEEKIRLQKTIIQQQKELLELSRSKKR